MAKKEEIQMTADGLESASRPTAAEIRKARAHAPKMRERDLARTIGVSEAELVASFVGHGTSRIDPRFDDLFAGSVANTF